MAPAGTRSVQFFISEGEVDYAEVYRVPSNVTKNYVINCLGDSITYGYISPGVLANPTWCQGVANILSSTVNNYEVSATSICNGSSESFITRLNRMTGTTVDMLIIFGGTNDYGDKRATTLGTINDTPEQGTNFYASFKYLIEAAINKYPSAVIAVIPPLRRYSHAKNQYGITINDIVDAEIEVAKYYGIPILDMFYQGGFNAEFDAVKNMFTSDGLHPNQAGINHILIPRFASFCQSLLLHR